MTALALFESFCWGVTGGSAVLITQNGVKLHGYRKARKDDHRRAIAERIANVSISANPAEPTATEDTGASEDMTPDVVEPIIGLRAWVINHGFLASSYTSRNSFGGAHWPAREKFSAACEIYRGLPTYSDRKHVVHEAPKQDCSCGVYACERELEIQYNAENGPFVWGRVALWGRVVQHNKGWRAQYAYPVSLVLVNAPHNGIYPGMSSDYVPKPQPPMNDDVLEGLRETLALRYGIPVRIGTLEELKDKHRENYEAMGIPSEVKEIVG